MLNLTARKLLIALQLILLSLTATAELKIPSANPNLAVTAQQQLGTRENDIGLAVGTTVPNFAINTHDNKAVTLNDIQSMGDTLVVFYRGGWCPYCNVQIHQLTEAWPEFEKRNITPVLISVDKTDGAALAQRTYEIPFPVLSDPELVAHHAFEVVRDVDDATFEKYKQYGIDLEAWSGGNHHKIAVTAAYIVDKNSVVKWAHTSLDYKTRPSVEQLLGVIDTMTR
jgi:peroxiredoxin